MMNDGKPTKQFSDLVEIIKILRRECPWDRKQSHHSIKDNLIEEAYETVEAIEDENRQTLKEELGDLLLHIVFHSRMAEETGDFTIEDVIYTLQEKLIHRHPHVFGDIQVEDEQEVAKNWETLKMDEGRTSVLAGVPRRLPALIRAQRMQEKAGSVGFDWKQSPAGKKQLWEKLQEELDEFKESYETGDSERIKEEYGDLLFSIVNAGRFLGLQAEDCLRLTNKKFKNRFSYIEKELAGQDKKITDASLEEMDQLWQQAKVVLSREFWSRES